MPTEAEIYGALTEIFREVFMRDDLALRAELTAKVWAVSQFEDVPISPWRGSSMGARYLIN